MIVSPEWFHEPRATDAQYAGNFSIEHVLATLTSPSLDPAIKRRLAKRMADYPETLAKSPILEQLVSALEEDTPAAATALRIATIFSASYEHILNLSDPLFTWIEFMITRRHSRPMNPPMTASGIDWKLASLNAETEFQRITHGNPLGFRKKIWQLMETP